MNPRTVAKAGPVAVAVILAAFLALPSPTQAWVMPAWAKMCRLDGGNYWETPDGHAFCVYGNGYIMCDILGPSCEWTPT